MSDERCRGLIAAYTDADVTGEQVAAVVGPKGDAAKGAAAARRFLDRP